MGHPSLTLLRLRSVRLVNRFTEWAVRVGPSSPSQLNPSLAQNTRRKETRRQTDLFAPVYATLVASDLFPGVASVHLPPAISLKSSLPNVRRLRFANRSCCFCCCVRWYLLVWSWSSGRLPSGTWSSLLSSSLPDCHSDLPSCSFPPLSYTTFKKWWVASPPFDILSIEKPVEDRVRWFRKRNAS